MKSILNNDTITLFPEGRIDSGNAPAAEKEILAIIEGNPEADLVIDASDLVYISSAGLRVLMRLRNSRQKTLKVINVSVEVYEILEVTGFTEILDVHKRMRFISSKGLEKLGSGMNSTVYRLDDENVLKAVRNLSLEAIKNEVAVSRAAFVYGIPTAIVYDVVETETGYGEVYEMAGAGVLSAAVMAEPEKKEYYLDEFVKVYRQIHEVDVKDSKFTSVKARYLETADEMTDLLGQDEIIKLKEFFTAIPDRTTFIHGDYHVGNIMLQDGELMLIDIGEAGYGHPLFDLAQTRLAFYHMSVLDRSLPGKVWGMSNELVDWFANHVFEKYFGSDGELLDKQMEIVHIMGLIRGLFVAKMQGKKETMLDLNALAEDLRKCFLADADRICALVKDVF